MPAPRGVFSAYAALGGRFVFFWGTTYLGIRISIETLPPGFRDLHTLPDLRRQSCW